MITVNSAKNAIGWLCDRPRAIAAVSLLRATIGLLGVVFYLSCWSERRFLFGPDGLYGYAHLRAQFAEDGRWSVYLLNESLVFFETVYGLSAVIAVLVLLGIGGRVVLAAHGVLLWSTYQANAALMDGGDNLIVLLIPFLLLTRCFAAFRVRPRSQRTRRESVFVSTTHNTGVLLICTQIMIVYLLAGLFKVQGSAWQDGTAIYSILRVPEFFIPGLTPLLFHAGWVLVVGAYATVLSSVFFPVLVVFRSGRPIAVAMMLVFHLMIALAMGLTSFALIMIATDLVFVSGQVERARLWIGNQRERLIGRLTT